MKPRQQVHLLHLALALFFLGSGLPPAASQLVGPEFQVNSFTTGFQYKQAVAASGSGNFVVVWQSSGQDGSDAGVFGQRFDGAGTPLGTEFQVNSYTTSYQRSPAVAADGSGNFVVVWESAAQDGSTSGVFGQRFDSAGIPQGSEFQVNSYTTSYQSAPAVSADGLGNFVVVWNSRFQDGSYEGVFGQRFSSAGTPAGSEFRINSYTTEGQYVPAVAMDGLGNFVVVWDSRYQDGSYFGVFGQRFSSAGTPLGSEFRANSHILNDQLDPAVAADSLGNFVVAWKSTDQDGSNYGVFGQRYNPAGVPSGNEFRINSYTTSDQGPPAVAADGAGNFVVVWASRYQDGSDYGVFGQRFNPAGTPAGGEFRVNTHTTSAQLFSAVAAAGSGKFVMTWSSSGQDGSGLGVFGQRYGSAIPIFADGFEAASACAWSAAVGGGCP
jgi:hypothetical protein